MTITLELTPEEEKLLHEAAAAEGTDAVGYIRNLVFATARQEIDVPLHPREADLRAVQVAQADLLAKGIGYVYQKEDGTIVRHLPDGTEELIAQ